MPGYFDHLKPKSPPVAERPVIDPGQATSYAAAALKREADAVATTPNGQRNQRLNKAWFKLGRHVGAGNIDAETVRTALAEAARACGLPEHEIATVLRDGPTSALRAGVEVPRHPTGTSLPPPRVSVVDSLDATDDAPDEEEDLSAVIRRRFPILDWCELWEAEDEEEWIVEPILPARRLVALFSAPKVGKSLLMLEVAVGIARGQPVLGVTPDRPRRVLYVDFENDPRGDVRTRLQDMGCEPAMLANLCYLSYPTIAKLDTAAGSAELMAVVAEYDCEVVVIDTISRAVAGEENENDTWLAFYRHTGLALKQRGIACIRLDHTGKDHEKGMRGGSAKYGDVDAVWKLAALSEDTFLLECTDNRMPVPHRTLTLIREAFPLAHRVMGTHWADVLDAQARQVDEDLERLGVPSQASVRECGKRLREAGLSVRTTVITKAVRARKARIDFIGEES